MAFDKETVEKMGLTWKEGMTDEEVFSGLKAIKEQAGKYDNLKSSFDKTASELADYKKKEKEGKSETDQLKESNAELSKQIAEMKKSATIRDIKDTYKGLGYSDDDATKIAQAQVEGKYDEVTKITADFMKKHDEALKKEFMGKTPTPNPNSPEIKVPKNQEEFSKLTYSELMALKENNPQVYEQFTKKK